MDRNAGAGAHPVVDEALRRSFAGCPATAPTALLTACQMPATSEQVASAHATRTELGVAMPAVRDAQAVAVKTRSPDHVL